MYEYVEKIEYAPVRKELEQIINRVQFEMQKNMGWHSGFASSETDKGIL